MRLLFFIILFAFSTSAIASSLPYEQTEASIQIEGQPHDIRWRIYTERVPATELRVPTDGADVLREMRQLNWKLHTDALTPSEYLYAYKEVVRPINWPNKSERNLDWAHRQKGSVDYFFTEVGTEWVIGEVQFENAVGFITDTGGRTPIGTIFFYPDTDGSMQLNFSLSPTAFQISRVMVRHGDLPSDLESKGLIKITSRTRGSYDLPQETEQTNDFQPSTEPLENIEQATFSSEPEPSTAHVDVNQPELNAPESVTSIHKWLITLGAAIFLGILAMWLLKRRPS